MILQKNITHKCTAGEKETVEKWIKFKGPSHKAMIEKVQTYIYHLQRGTDVSWHFIDLKLSCELNLSLFTQTKLAIAKVSKHIF